MSGGIALGVYGKHPAFGDFLSAGLPDAVNAVVADWLDSVLPEMKALLAERWEQIYDAAPALRFWIGGDIAGAGSLAGVMLFSRDKVGRRFPLVVGAAQTNLAPPVFDPDQAVYDRIQGQVAALDPVTDAGAAGMIETLHLDLEPGALEEPSFWAVRPGAEISDLWADVSVADHLRAAAGRSYWWAVGNTDGQSAVYACAGFPPAQALCWLISDATKLPAMAELVAELELE